MKKDEDDIAIVGQPEEDGSLPYIRSNSKGVSAGKFVLTDDPSSVEGGEVVSLENIQGNVYRVRATSGPAKVNSDAYRTGWENIFGAKQTVGEA